MDKREEQINMIQDLYNLGSITEQEYHEMLSVVEKEYGNKTPTEKPIEINNSKKKSSFFNLKVLGGIVLILLIIAWGWKKLHKEVDTSDEEMQAYVQKICDCDQVTYNAEKAELEVLKQKIINKEIQFQDDVDDQILRISEKKSMNSFSTETRKCNASNQAIQNELLLKYPIDSPKGKEFWATKDILYANKKDYSFDQYRDNIKEEIEQAKLTIIFKSTRDRLVVTEKTTNQLTNFFQVYGRQYYFDANSWFTSEIDQYSNSKNITPDDVNSSFIKYFNENETYEYTWIPESLTFQDKEEELMIWTCKVNFKAVRPSEQKTQTSLVTFELKLDNYSLKIKSFREIKVENTQYESIYN